MSRILVIEDNRTIAHGIRSALEGEGYDVRLSADGPAGLACARHWLPRLVILDLTLPGLDGLQVLRTFRSEGLHMPVIILSARTSEPDRIRGLRIGADDYLTKPFSLDELLARVDAHLRRESLCAPARPAGGPDANLVLGALSISAATREVTYGGAPLPLRPREFDLLHALARRRGDLISRQELLHEVWGYEAGVESRTVDTHIVELRRKLDAASGGRPVILTVRKAGYRIDVDS